ncbi:50S ribosomal protein L21 [Flaviflagellibacter deserti]|jgi:large subunit ribosomal protein L21|uniref:Large ribosomal subunit protein bL21 n=1 Tax=Flaviflagellibacter deserti TaxID=2267266 RepID=A0ABV9Z7D0_9HYPH
MFAVIKTGGKQYRVAANDKITVGRLAGDVGSTVELGEVLALGGDTPSFGAPFVDGARVVIEIVEHSRGDKVIAFKKRRRQNSKRKRGHRQDHTVIRITDILAKGQEASAKPKAAKKVVEATDADAAPAKKPAAKKAAKAAETETE